MGYTVRSACPWFALMGEPWSVTLSEFKVHVYLCSPLLSLCSIRYLYHVILDRVITRLETQRQTWCSLDRCYQFISCIVEPHVSVV